MIEIKNQLSTILIKEIRIQDCIPTRSGNLIVKYETDEDVMTLKTTSGV